MDRWLNGDAAHPSRERVNPMIEVRTFGSLSSGVETNTYRLVNRNGMIVEVAEYGAAIVRVMTPDKRGKIEDVVLGFDNVSSYERDGTYQGSIIGRCANRITQGQLHLNHEIHQLSQNEGPHHLHGGVVGFGKKLWSVQEQSQALNHRSITFSLRSAHGEEGYPGNLDCKVRIDLSDANCLTITYEASCDQTTAINLTHHPYFNLKDGGRTSALEHRLEVFSEYYTPLNEAHLPTGQIRSVSGTKADFRFQTLILERLLGGGDEVGSGINANYLFNSSPLPKPVARLTETTTGRRLSIASTQPALQFYSGDHLKNISGRNGTIYNNGAGICLEPQNCPDASRHPKFPTNILNPGEIYFQVTEYWFDYCV